MSQLIPQLNLSHLPLQQALVDSIYHAFIDHEDVLAAVLLGSLAAETGDRVSDADVIVFTTNGFHRTSDLAYRAFESNKEIFYCLGGFHNDHAFFKKYIFNDMTSAEIHCLDLEEPFMLSKPYKVLFDKSDIVTSRLTDAPAPKHKDFPAYTSGDQGLIWELFDCIKWLSRDDTNLAKEYIKKLANKLLARPVPHWYGDSLNRPILYIFSGLPASGKSTLAQHLAQHTSSMYVRIDTVEQGLRDLCSFKVEGEGYRLSYRIIEDNLRLGISAIADSCNPIELTRREWRDVATSVDARFVDIEIRCSDKEEHKHRVQTRPNTVKNLVLPNWEQVENRHYEAWPDDVIRIDTAGKSIEQAFTELLDKLEVWSSPA